MIMTMQPPPMTALPSAAFLGKPPQPAITATGGSNKKGLDKKKTKKNAPNNNNSNNSAGADSADKKPMRPYTEYNIFFQLERELILKTHNPNQQPSSSPPTTTAAAAAHPTSPSRTVAPGAKREDTCCYTDPLPARWSSLTLPSKWYISGQKKPKRKHRKSHGVIGFVQLTKMISERWKSIDDVSKQFCKDMAKKGMVVYKESMRVYNDRHGIAPANGGGGAGSGAASNNKEGNKKKTKASNKAEKGADKKAKKESTTKKRKAPTTASSASTTAATATAAKKSSSSSTNNNSNKKQKKYMSASALQWKQRQILSAATSVLQQSQQQHQSQHSQHRQVMSATKSGLAQQQQQQQAMYSLSGMQQPTPIVGATKNSSSASSALPQHPPGGAPQHLSAAQHLGNAHHQQQARQQASQVQHQSSLAAQPFAANKKIASLLTDDQKSDPSIDVEIDHFLRCIGRDEERDGLTIVDDINATIAKSRNNSSNSLSGSNSLSHNIAHGLMGRSDAGGNTQNLPSSSERNSSAPSAPAPSTTTTSVTRATSAAASNSMSAVVAPISSSAPVSMLSTTAADDLLREPFGAFECDMQDDEIMGIWQSLSVDPTATTITPEPSQSSYLHESYSPHSSQQQSQQQPRAVSVASNASSSSTSSSSLQHMYSQHQQQQQQIGVGGNNGPVSFPPPLPALPTSASLTLSSNHGNLMQSFDTTTANFVCQEVHHNNIAALDKKLGSLNETDFLNSIDDATSADATGQEFNPNMLAGRKA